MPNQKPTKSKNMRQKSRRARPVQLELPLQAPGKIKRGGARAGAGRKPGAGRRRVEHRSRAALSSAHPVHVVLRSQFRPLRSQFVFPTVRRALAKAARAHAGFRVLHFSVPSDHLHLIVEASGERMLSRGMQGLAIRVARAVNRLVFRTGKVWADRFYSRALMSPRALRNALAYVLNNFRKHGVRGARRIDPYSSAPYFAGFRELSGLAPFELPTHPELPLVPRGVPPPHGSSDVPVVASKTWLGQRGWRRAGAISFGFRGAV